MSNCTLEIIMPRSEKLLAIHADCIVLKRILDKCVARHEEEMAQIDEKMQKVSRDDGALLEQFKSKLLETRSPQLNQIKEYLSQQTTFLKRVYPELYK